MRKLTTAATVMLVSTAIAGCDGLSGGADDSASGTRSPTPSGPNISGIVVLDTRPPGTSVADRKRDWALNVYDPETGKKKLTLTIPVSHAGAASVDPFGSLAADATVATARARASFSPDWRYAAYYNREGIHLLELDMDGKRYEPKTVIKRTDFTLRFPTFAPTGHRLWFRRQSLNKDELVSVDYRSPDQPRKEATIRPGTWVSWRLLPAGRFTKTTAESQEEPGSYDFTLYGPDGEPAPEVKVGDGALQYAMVDGRLADAHLQVGSSEYGFVATVDDRTALLRASREAAREYGAIVTAHIEPEQGRATIASVTKARSAEIRGVALAPDRKRVLLASKHDWFVRELDPGGEPQPQHWLRENPRVLTHMLGWTK